jgi:Cu2+-containing amine oxidase
MNCPVSRIAGLKPSSAVRLALFAHKTSKLRPRPPTFWARSCLLSSLCLLIGMSASAQGPALDAAATHKPQSNVPCLDQTVAFSSGSTWTLCVAAVQRYGLVITNANFQKSRSSPPINVLYDGRIGELFVPYHPGAPRLFDIRANYSPLVLTPSHRPPPPRVAELIGDNKICKEIRTYLAWMDDAQVRYGKEVVYFAVLDAANYNYIMEWTFRDDGTILARAGSTGPQLSTAFGVGHMHSFTWRLDVDLNGPDDDSVYFTRHVENLTPPSTSVDDLFLVGIEGSRVWNPERFHALEIFDRTLQNGHGRPTSYELIPLRTGSARHSEDFTKKDFWVTRFRGVTAELLAENLPNYVADQQPTVNTDIVVWYTGSVHHENNERDEDDNTTPVLWTGFELRPKNLFDGTPFWKP